jgi:serine protease Do
MSTRKTTWFYGALIAMASLAIGMVIASRLDMTPSSAAQALATTAPPPMNSAPVTGPLDAQTFRNIAQTQSPIVVSIRTTATRRTQEMTDFFGGDEFFRRFFGQPDGRGGQGGQGGGGGGQGSNRRGGGGSGQPEETFGAGTGFIIEKSGLIVTNNHVVENATKISVEILGDDEPYDAKVVGRDPLSDSALIELVKKPVRGLPEAKFGDSDQMQPGDWVMAIGNPFGLDHTVSVGVISALSRQFPVANQRNIYMLQTDAAINPGNSGGPLLNLRGEVIGINTAILTGTGQNLGIGFAVPINIVRELLPQLRTGRITRGMIGVSILQGPISQAAAEERGLKDRKGAIVSSVSNGSPSEKAGVKPGDVVVEFNNKPITNDRTLVDLVVATKPGTTVPVKVIRDGASKTLNVTVGELNLDAEASNGEDTSPGDLSKDFGLTLDDVTPAIARKLRLPAGVSGAFVTEIRPRSPAARAAITEGDVIIRIGRTDVEGATEAVRLLQKVQPGQAIGVMYIREGQQLFTTMRRE